MQIQFRTRSVRDSGGRDLRRSAVRVAEDSSWRIRRHRI
jgi:hypothetical protein